MQYVATFVKRTYRGQYGYKGDDGWETSYVWTTLEARTDEEATDQARAHAEKHGRMVLSRLFTVEHDVITPSMLSSVAS
ncbi:MAG: hypothetical protein UY71_C0039G0001 [Parcubacteria group bacterium GW2011_GWB1_52_7]|nr:MAG: hypothetical protein UY71_C0039G0001 [Parcubacteria group bacterium GW2011_GWB1_52_7]